jgi:hypothetical protein
MAKKAFKKFSIRALARSKGFRSGLEDTISEQLKRTDNTWSYESEKLKYTIPERVASYTPDFILIKSNGEKMYIETKGRFTAVDRKKHLLVKISNPDIDLRILFQTPNNKLSKASKTTYANWADKNGYLWAAKEIPAAWLEE